MKKDISKIVSSLAMTYQLIAPANAMAVECGDAIPQFVAKLNGYQRIANRHGKVFTWTLEITKERGMDYIDCVINGMGNSSSSRYRIKSKRDMGDYIRYEIEIFPKLPT